MIVSYYAARSSCNDFYLISIRVRIIVIEDESSRQKTVFGNLLFHLYMHFEFADSQFLLYDIFLVVLQRRDGPGPARYKYYFLGN